jgi:hypothetical protein
MGTRPQEALPPLREMLERVPGVELADAAEQSADAPNAGAGWPPIYYGLLLLEKAVVALPQVRVPLMSSPSRHSQTKLHCV